jgi:hypothetical protein
VSLAHQSHPEFEYFRPLWTFLRKAGIAVALTSFTVIGGALVLWAGHDSTADSTLMAARVNDMPSSAPTASVADRATPATAAETPPLPEASAAACEQDTWAYLDGKCTPAKARKLRGPRAATDRLLGRSALPVPAASGLPPKLATGADAAASAPEAVKPTGQSNPVPKKARKTATSQTNGHDAGKSNSSSREERARDERWNARAYASPDSRNPAGTYERSWGWSR